MCQVASVEKESTAASTKTKYQKLKDLITVEPLIACYQMALSLSKPTLSNMEFEKACRVNLGYNDTICNAILNGNHSSYKNENSNVQRVISTMHSWQQPIQSFTPLFLIVFLGSFSDRHKWRKPFLLIPIVGELFGLVGCICCVIFMDGLPLEIQGLFQNIIPSLFGGQTMIIMATTAYIADISSVEMRTLRLGVVQIVISVVLLIVQSVSGIFFVGAGYFPVLGCAVALNLIALGYGMVRVEEFSNKIVINRSMLMDVFNPRHAIDTFNLALKKSKDNDRLFIWLLIIMSFIYRSAFIGESNLLYLYTQNVFQWTPLEFSYFLTINSLVSLIGHVFGVPLFTRILHLSDLAILLITIGNKIVTNVVFGLARNVIIFYTGLGVGILSRIYRTAKKSLATKIVSKNDIGKAQSLLGICDILAPAASVPIYNNLFYVNSLDTFPAAFFFLGILLYGICCVLVMLMYCYMKRKLNKVVPSKCDDVLPTIQTNDIEIIESSCL